MVSVSAVIFGVDGTILDTVDLHAAAWQQAFGRFGREVSREKLRSHVGKGADQLLPVFLSPEEIGWIGAGIASLHDRIYERELLPGARVFPKVRELFERVAGDGRRIVLASSLPRRELDASTERAGVGDLVSWAVSADDAERSKPRPDILEAALDRLGSVDPREVVLVGDTPSDAEAAAKLGILTVGLLCGGFPEMELVEAGCAALYRDPEDLLARYDASPLAPRRERLAG
ncbi:HAD family hydrolase [Sorangium sp. So ce887]|uniref:HAD family hydrolase n=1 Tax=Sorangium sp. So ce887 TaxID=3133324 RepID=UPI003F642B74